MSLSPLSCRVEYKWASSAVLTKPGPRGLIPDLVPLRSKVTADFEPSASSKGTRGAVSESRKKTRGF